jgi:sugar phosphate isomerase/epimerase
MNRREFLGTMTAATLLSCRLASAASEHSVAPIGLQLYTVRTEMKKDFEGTIAKVAATGYKEVEFAGYFDRSPKDVRAILDRNGLAAPSTHVDYKSLGDKWPEVVEAGKVIGHKYIVNPWIDDEVRKSADGWKRAADTFNRAGEVSKKAGIQFAYHNHWFEFIPVNGKMPYDLLLESCDPELVKMELDLCWITVGGQDPVKYFERYPGRFPMVHVKDVKQIPSDKNQVNFDGVLPGMTEVGSGIIDWRRIFAASGTGGVQHYFVEHDQPQAPFESIKISYQYLSRLRY